MNKNTIQKASFNQVRKLNLVGTSVLYVSTALVVATIAIENFGIKLIELNDGINALNSILITAYFAIEIIASYLLLKVEGKRRLDFIDNSFDTNLAGIRSENYFTNSVLHPGLYKMAVNCFENSYFSYNVSRKMWLKLLVKNSIIISIFLFAASMGTKEIVILLFQLSLPVILIQQFVKLLIYISNNELVLSNFQSLFNDLKNGYEEKKAPEILKNIIYYESNLSWASILLSDKIFQKENATLSEEWTNLKKEYNIPIS